MKKGFRSLGYTIVEVMIFLAVSAALVVSAILLIGGQQNRAQFNTAIRDIELQIQDVMNDVATGYYSNTGNVACSSTGSGPIITSSATNTHGTNEDCIFMGRVMHFGVHNSDRSGLNIYSVVGQRQAGPAADPHQVTSLTEALPRLLTPGSGPLGSIPSGNEEITTLRGGLHVENICYGGECGVGGSTPIGAIVFMSSLASYESSGGDLVSGSQTINLIPVLNTALDQTSVQVADAFAVANAANLSISNPNGGVVICLESGTTNELGRIFIGNNGRQLTTRLEIESGDCS